jgi:MinD-like ATPase involved in chromosome partitioning or flagellar assembly
VLAGSGLGEPRWKTANSSQQVLPADATGDQVREALRRVKTGGARRPKASAVATRLDDGVSRSAAHSSGGRQAQDPSSTMATGTVIAFTGACDGLGSSTVAANVGAVLGRRATTVLVEADTLAPSFAAALGLDPARNVYLVAHERPGRDAQRWATAMATELQPLDVASPHATVLCGVPRPSLRTALDPGFVTSLLQRLRAQAELVLVDVPAGREEGTTSAALHAAVLESADRILITTTPDIVGLRRTAAFIEWLVGRPGGAALRPRLSLVVNRHRPRHHADPAEIAEVMRVPVAGTIPDDAEAMQRSLDLQRPLVGCSNPRRGSAARALEDLAGLVEKSHESSISAHVSKPRPPFSAPWRRR